MALQIARGIAARNPDAIAYQVLVAQILAEKPGSEDVTVQRIVDLRRLYKLDASNEANLVAAEQAAVTRKISSVT